MTHFSGLLQLSECGFLVESELQGVDFGLRVFSPGGRDPVSGNSSGWLGYGFLAQGSLTGPVMITQGRALGRQGVVTIYPDDNGNIIVAGKTFTRIVGTAKFI